MQQVQPNLGKTIQRLRVKRGLSQETLAQKAGLHRTAIGKIESGEREPSLSNSMAIANALHVPLQELYSPHEYRVASGLFSDPPPEFIGVTKNSIKLSIEEVYTVLDAIDSEMQIRSVPKISSLIELANLSAMVGNIIGMAFAKYSGGYWVRNGPHKYPDLIRPIETGAVDGIEIKVALEKNTPKGHLPKPGKHISIRYVLTHSGDDFSFNEEYRGDAVSIWEVKCGILTESDFNLSNTPGDSGKTANFSSDAFKRMKLVYFDDAICPYRNSERYLSSHGHI